MAAYPIPRTWSKKKKRAAFLGTTRPTGRPDADNLLKALDSFNEIVFRDDAQIVEAHVLKIYSDMPALTVTVRPFA